MKKILKKYFSNLAYFYNYLGYRIILAVLMSIAIGVLDGLGISLFLPLLQMVNSGNAITDVQGMGNLKFLISGIQTLGMEITLTTVLLIMVGFFVLKGLAKYYSGIYRVNILQYFIRKLRLRMLNAFNRMGFKEFVTADVGRIQNTMSGEVEKVARALSMYFGTLEQSILVAVYIGFAFIVDLRFAALVSIGGLLTNILYNYFYKLTKTASSKLTHQANIYQGQVLQHVGNFKYLKATALLQTFADKLKQTILLIEKNRTNIGRYAAFLNAAREPLMIIIVAIVILLHVNLFGGSLGSILISLLFFYRALSALTSMQTNWNKFLENSGSLENVQTFQELIVGAAERNGSSAISKFEDTIQLENVYFKYNDKDVLQNVSLKIGKNEIFAFVGESGSGKTTLVNILAGLLPVETGRMKIDNIDRNEIDVFSYQRRIGYVTQEPVIFNDTVFNNITFWAAPTPENIKRFNEVIEQTSLNAFIIGLAEREHTMLGNNGINISGGQKQRISIARELYKDIDILILDEATSALDTETEKAIQENIDHLRGKLTILMVAHRLSTVRNADKIVLMSNGRIVDVDNFESLRYNNEIFKNMVELQEVNQKLVM